MNGHTVTAAVYYEFIATATLFLRKPSAVEGFIDRLALARYREGLRNGKNRLMAGHLGRVFPPASKEEIDAVIRDFWRRHQRNIVTLYYLRRFGTGSVDGLIRWKGRELLERALDDGKGVLLLVPHYGDERSLHILLGMKGYSVGVITSRYLDMPVSVRRAKLRMGKRWNHLHFPGESPRWIYDTLSLGEIVHFAPTAYGGPSGTWVMNFGVPVLAPSSPWKIASSSKCSVLTAYCTQLPGMKFSLEFRKFTVPSSREEMIQALFRDAEAKALENPGQYAWEQLLIRHRESNTIARMGMIPADETVLEKQAVGGDHDPENMASLDRLMKAGP